MKQSALRKLIISRRCLTLWCLVSILALPMMAHADRASPAYMYEKKGVYGPAAMYYGRMLRGLHEIYMAFHWNSDPAANAAGKYSTEYVQLPMEIEQRYEKCLNQANLTPAQIKRMDYINYLWMSEMVDQEKGGQRTACPIIAVEAERHGDFTLADFARRGEARYYRVVAVPFHEKSAREFEDAGQKELAASHDQAVIDYKKRAERTDTLAQGNKVLKGVSGLRGPSLWLDTNLYPDKVNPVSFQYLPRRLFSKDGQWKGKKTEEVASILKREGLKHADENVRFSTVNILSNLGEKETVLSALNDPSTRVRLTAAEALADMRWADGWAACHGHSDARVSAIIAPLLEPAGEDIMIQTFVITELISGLNSSSADTRSFCEAAMEGITGKKMKTDEWTVWWKSLGDPQPGLVRTGSGVPPDVDETIDFGAWWQSTYQRAPNPLLKYEPPATIRWDGYLIITKPGQYRLYTRNCGEGRNSRNRVTTPGRMGFPGLYLPESSARLAIDGEIVLPNASDVVQDPSGIRLDFSEPIQLDSGLHKIHLEFEYRSKRTGYLVPEPCIRLYWSSEHFLREVIPTQHMVSLGAEELPKNGSYAWSFEEDEPGAVPTDWKAGTPAAIWQVIEDKTAPSGERVLALASHRRKSNSVRDACWTDTVSFLDGEIEVRFKAVEGEIEKGGGVIWRVQDERTYYSARTNYGPRGNNIGLYCMVNWDRVWKVYAENVFLSVGQWYTMKIVHRGDNIKVYLDGKKLLDAIHKNSPLNKPGGVGVGTKGDAVTSFDDLAVRTSRSKGKVRE